MFIKYHTRGIVISGRPDGNDSRTINAFTENFGLIFAKAQGARTLHSKMRVGLQDFSLSELSLIRGKSGWKIVSVRPEKNFFELLRSDDDKLKIAGNVLNLVKKLVSEETHSSGLFAIVSNFFDFLILAEEKNVALAECLTLIRILHILGYMKSDPEISLPISSDEITTSDLQLISPRRSKIISIINESLKIAQ